MKIKEIKSKKAQKWARINKNNEAEEVKHEIEKGYFGFLWHKSPQKYCFWLLVYTDNPTTEELKKDYPELFKK